MPVFDRFVPSLVRPLPAMYLVRSADTAVVNTLRRHGVRTMSAETLTGQVERFVVDSIERSPRSFQGHNEIRLAGRWQPSEAVPARELVAVPTEQPLGQLAAILLDPESDDGVATWNLLDASLRVGGAYPVLRIAAPGQAAR
jgi:hypothetical protein